MNTCLAASKSIVVEIELAVDEWKQLDEAAEKRFVRCAMIESENDLPVFADRIFNRLFQLKSD